MSYELDPQLARGTGRTTRIAINLIDAMLKEPGKEFEIVDHSGSRNGDLYLLRVVETILRAIGADFIASESLHHGRLFILIKPINRFYYDTTYKPEWARFGLSKHR